MANEELAARLGVAMERWSLSDPEPVSETQTSWVLRVKTKRGIRALKLLKPYGFDEINGARLMQLWGGDGAATVEAIDGHDVLMEWLEGTTLADVVRADNGRDPEATEVLCDVVARLHRKRDAPPPELWTLDYWMRQLRESDLTFLPVEARPLWQRAQAMLADLLATTAERVPLHGDLHHENVIGSGTDWRAIDPKGLIGDPHYEVANVFRNPHGAEELALRQGRINRLADTFERQLGWDGRRLMQWAAVHSAISAIWDHAAGRVFAFELRMVPALLAAVDRRSGA
jgi:streptomycin 6-kinase